MNKKAEVLKINTTQETIGQFLSDARIRQWKRRLEALKKIDSPDIVIKTLEDQIKSGDGLKGVGKIDKFAHMVYTEVIQAPGKGGKYYLRFKRVEGRDIIFAEGQYGPFCYEENK